jgi:hypothetical protein
MEPNQPTSLPQLAGHVLHDLQHYLSAIDPILYQAPLEILSNSTIGQHTRHIIEFYNCLIEQSADGQQPVISYAMRRRDILIETAPEHALYNVNQILEKLHGIDTSKSCLIDCAEHGQDKLQVPSTLGREMIYTIEHTIHHLAIVKIALKATNPSITLPEHFGVAPSTIRHRQESCAQ